MPSYQVPQFLDSGDKIIGPLNIRQLAYVLTGGLIGFGIFSLFPSNPILGLTLGGPIFLFGVFLGFGRFNGRDIEVYIFKFIEKYKLSRKFTYTKQAHTPELDVRLSHLNIAYLSNQMNKRYQKLLDEQQQKFTFRNQPLAEKIARIRKLSGNLDEDTNNQFASLYESEQHNALLRREFALDELSIYSKIRNRGPKLRNQK